MGAVPRPVYTFALLVIAFDMEMAYMYPRAAVFRDIGVFAYGGMLG